MADPYDERYRETADLFGEEAEGILRDHWRRIPAGSPVLDVGVGQGRNALFLARQGFEVHGIDPSSVAVESVSERAAREGLSITATCCDFASYDPAGKRFGAVLLFGLLQILDRGAIGVLAARARAWTVEGSLLFVTAFTKEDATFARWAGEGNVIGRNSFRRDDGEVRTFFEPGEVPGLFARFETVHHWEGLGPWHRHGGGPEERHAKVACVLRR